MVKITGLFFLLAATALGVFILVTQDWLFGALVLVLPAALLYTGLNTQKCAHCGGSGRVQLEAQESEGKAHKKHAVKTEICPDCKGRGKISGWLLRRPA